MNFAGATTPGCALLLGTSPRPAAPLAEVIETLRSLTSPSVATSILADNPSSEALSLIRGSSLSARARRRLTELAFARLTAGHDVDREAVDRALDLLFADAAPVHLPARRPRGWIFRRRAIALGPPDADLIRQLFRARPAEDLRRTSPRLAAVQSRPKYFDTFAATITALFDDVREQPPGELNDFDQWTATLETLIRRNFANASAEVRAFVAFALDRYVLGVPATPATDEVLSEILRERATRVAPIPGRGLEERVIPTAGGRARVVGDEGVAESAAPAPDQPRREVIIASSARREVDELPSHLREKLDEFLENARDPVRYHDMTLARGRWNIEALKQFGPDAWGARLTRGYRVLYELTDDAVTVRRVNKGQIHGN